MSDNYLFMKAVDYVDDRYLGKYFSMKEKLSHQKIKRKKAIKWSINIAVCFLVVLIAVPVIMHFTQHNTPAPVIKYYDNIAEVRDDLGYDTLYSKLELNGASIMLSYKSDEDGNAQLNSPLQLKIGYSYSTEAGKDAVDYYILFDKDNVDDSYIGGYDEQGLTKIINGVTVHYSEIFDGSNHTQAKFIYEGNLYVIDIVSTDKIDLDHYLNSLLCD